LQSPAAKFPAPRPASKGAPAKLQGSSASVRRDRSKIVMPAQAGIQGLTHGWIPASAGMTD